MILERKSKLAMFTLHSIERLERCGVLQLQRAFLVVDFRILAALYVDLRLFVTDQRIQTPVSAPATPNKKN